MCGITGSINFTFEEEKVLKAMRHRGPDDQNGYSWENVQFFHLRLSILDIKGGKQPMHLADRYSIVFNGEIFNHQELRKQFNLQAQTSSDTETLLLLYEKFQTGFLNYLDGMFAFAILDKVNNSLFIARDRAGVKPLYIYHDENSIVFASELNALKNMLPLEMEESHFYNYLRFGTFYRSQTPYKDVTELQAGTYMLVDCASLVIDMKRWWNIQSFYKQNNTDPFEESVEKTDRFLHQAIRRRLESSDLEVATFLSGGIDSGLVTAIAHQYNPSLKTFTVSFDGTYDESSLARLVADKYKTQHTEIKISFDNLQNDVERILENYGEPFFDSSAIPSYYVSKSAKEFVTVVLNGDGADEMFGGYRRYVPFARYDFFRSSPQLRATARLLRSLLPPAQEKKSLYNYIYRLISFASVSGPEIYLSAGSDIFEGFTRFLNRNSCDYLGDYIADFDVIAGADLGGLDKLMQLDFDINLFNDLLVKIDIATMANSQEGRSPFLCKEILEYVPTLPAKFKVNGKQTKVLLRTLAKKYLPEALIHQPKRGFEVPLKRWVDFELKEIISDRVHSSDCLYKRFVNEEFISQLLSRKVNISEEKRAKIIWTIFAMEVWYKKNWQST